MYVLLAFVSVCHMCARYLRMSEEEVRSYESRVSERLDMARDIYERGENNRERIARY